MLAGQLMGGGEPVVSVITYTYDPDTGNLASKDSQDYTYLDAAHKHAVTAVDENLYSYDANGNMITRAVEGKTYAFGYDYENHLTTVSGDAALSFTYNGDGQRVVATEGFTTTIFVGK